MAALSFVKGLLTSTILFALVQVLLESNVIDRSYDGECDAEHEQRPLPIYKGPPEAVIQQAKERSQHISSFRPSTSNILLGRLNPNLFKVSNVSTLWKSSHFPDINIIGLPKAGTSHLFQMLTSHPNLTQFHRRKEFCFSDDPADLQELIRLYHKTDITSNSYAPWIQRATELLWKANKEGSWLAPKTPYARTVNGCLRGVNVILQRQYLQRNDAKFIMLLRDPADWIWAAYNFWFWHFIDSGASTNSWASAPYQYRSPKLFHEHMLAGERSQAFKSFMQIFRNDKASWYTALVSEVFDKESLLVLKVEHFAPDAILTSGVLEKLSKFLGIDPAGFNPDIVKSYGNCGDDKGVLTVCKRVTATDAYTITGGRGMLKETRELVHIHFAQECKLWAEKFDIIYTECLEVGSRYVTGNRTEP